MPSSQNYYQILDISPSADLDTIKRAYRNRIRGFHPDQFAARLADLKQTGTPSAVRALEREILAAKQMTQRINEAYAVLSDETERTAYDQFLSNERQRTYNADMRRQRMQHWEAERRTVKSRPHHQNPAMQNRPRKEGIPWFILIGLIVLLLFVSALFSNAITENHTPFTTYVPRNPTSEGSILALDLQATTNAEQATMVARATIVFDPTSTPRSSSANERLGDRMMSYGQLEQAIVAYQDAIVADNDKATLYYKLGIAYNELPASEQEGEFDPIEAAFTNYTAAIQLDETLADAYLRRGLLYYELWQLHDNFALEARADLEDYLALTENDDQATVIEILEQLPD